MQRRKVTLPLSGSEPPYEPQRWNSQKDSRASHNCYAYFLQDLQARDLSMNNSFPQPGAHALSSSLALHRKGLYANVVHTDGSVKISVLSQSLRLAKMPSRNPYRCREVSSAVLADNPQIYRVDRTQRCASTHYKGFLAVDSNVEDSDYHFWIQNADGTWSHKPGEQNVRNTDIDGKPIRDPLYSNRGRYDKVCGYFCVPANDYGDTQSRSNATNNVH